MTDDAILDLALIGPSDSACAAECRDADAVVVALSQLALPVTPSPSIRAALLETIAREKGTTTRLSADAIWEETGLPGLTRRILFVDCPANRLTMLLRLAAGGRLPEHPHHGVEEILLLEGDLHASDGGILRAGDYQRNEAGSVHVEQWSVAGCMALMVVPVA